MLKLTLIEVLSILRLLESKIHGEVQTPAIVQLRFSKSFRGKITFKGCGEVISECTSSCERCFVVMNALSKAHKIPLHRRLRLQYN
jgi:hypothetical protein